MHSASTSRNSLSPLHGERVKVRGLRLMLLLALAGGGCSTAKWTVKPHQRELLADRIMQPDGNAQETAADEHILANREGAIGGSGTSGGGCGCN